jgi:hypothetical protein
MGISKKSTSRLPIYIRNSLFVGLLLVMIGLLQLAAANVQMAVIQSNYKPYFEQTNQSINRQLDDTFKVSAINAGTIDTPHQTRHR